MGMEKVETEAASEWSAAVSKAGSQFHAHWEQGRFKFLVSWLTHPLFFFLNLLCNLGVSLWRPGERQRGPEEQHPTLLERPLHTRDSPELEHNAVGHPILLRSGPASKGESQCHSLHR